MHVLSHYKAYQCPARAHTTMAEEDIYGNKARYERFLARLDALAQPPGSASDGRRGVARYWCRNPENLACFRALAQSLAARDSSYARRHRIMQSLRLICDATTRSLRDCDRADVDAIMARAHERLRSPKSKETFIADIKHIFKLLYPERDRRGRADETVFPYPVRHLSRRIDKSRERMRDDKFTWEEFEQLVGYFASDPRMQCYLTFALESLGRPQELLYLRLRDVELHDDYAKVYLREHGKEGIGLLQCIDSYAYLLKWLDAHPYARDPESFLFVNTGATGGRQLRPENINKMIRRGCKALGITKPITCYSLKRNGVTIRRLRGESDLEIQRAARWTSTKQLKTYDLSNQDDAFRLALQKRGLLPADDGAKIEERPCAFCGTRIGFADTVCRTCKHAAKPASVREKLADDSAELNSLREEVRQLREGMALMRQEVMDGFMRDIINNRAADPAEAPQAPRRA